MKNKYFWIKQRNNPQLGTYYVKMGNISVREAKSHVSETLYGWNAMLQFSNEKEYLDKIEELQTAGQKIQ